MAQYLCGSCGYPMIATSDDLGVMFTTKFARAILLDNVDHPLLVHLPLEDFAGYRSFIHDKMLLHKIHTSKPTFRDGVDVGYSSIRAVSLLDEIRIRPLRNYHKSTWQTALEEILVNHYGRKEHTDT